MSEHYILDEHHNAIPVDLMTWARAFEGNRHVARTTVYEGCEVSTVFLGLDHNFGSGPPLIFETLVFGGPFDKEMDRYSTWDEALAGHARMVEKCQPMTENTK
jgi:hypothetical protein